MSYIKAAKELPWLDERGIEEYGRRYGAVEGRNMGEVEKGDLNAGGEGSGSGESLRQGSEKSVESERERERRTS